MQTSLPELPFTNYGRAQLDPCGFHSLGETTPRSHLRTDLETLVPWTSFPNDIHLAIQCATTRSQLPLSPFNISGGIWSIIVETEENIRAHATYTLHISVEEVVKKFEMKGRFALTGGSAPVVGDPDFLWVVGRTQKVIVEYKAWWLVNLADIPAAFDKSCRDTLTPQSLDALEQIYGYMAFNNNKFGILTNWQRALFLRRAERPNGKTLEYYLVELDGSANSPISMLKAWVGMVLLAEDDCSYVPTCYLARNFGTSAPSLEQQKNTDGYRMRPINGEYQPLPLHLCHFDLSSARRGATGCVLNGRFPQPYLGKDDLHVIYKVVDVLRYPDAADWIEDEARAYAALRHLQGQVIPTLYGFYEVWGIIHLLVLEPVGNAIREDEEIDQTLRIKMQAALRHVHDAGFVHGDIARRNFCRTEKGDVFLVDLELCKAAKNQSELSSEMEEVDKL